MSSGHRHSGGFGIDTGQLDRLMKNEAVRECFNRPFVVSRDSDLPYIGGYSTDGHTIYLDRHLPATIRFEIDGKKYEFDPTPFLILHERTEKALIDALKFNYTPAHRVATAAERRLFVQMIGPGAWPHYQGKMDQYAKHDEHEKLTKVPSDLDMTPYLEPPVDKKLVAHMDSVMHRGKYSKEEAKYSADSGTPKRHCGPSKAWPKNSCEYYKEDHGCSKVAGYISHEGVCDWYEKED